MGEWGGSEVNITGKGVTPADHLKGSVELLKTELMVWRGRSWC